VIPTGDSDRDVAQVPTIRQFAARLALFVAVLLVLNAAWWAVEDLGHFRPQSGCGFQEHVFLATVTAAGPFAMVIGIEVTDVHIHLPAVCGLILLCLVVSIRWRRIFTARWLGYFGIVFWFLTGFGGAVLRIT
jgi:hypothetical protein